MEYGEGRAQFSLKNITFEKNFEIQNIFSRFFTNQFNFEEIKNYAMPILFCGILTNILCILYFTNSKISIKEKILTLLVFAIFIASFYIKGVNLIWSLGNSPAWYKYRYTFCFIFIYIITAYRSFENIKQGTNYLKIILTTAVCEIIGILVIKLNLGVINENYIKYDLILTLIFGIMLLLYKANFKAKIACIIPIIIAVLSISNLIVNANANVKIIMDNASKNQYDQYKVLSSYFDSNIQSLSEKDNSIYRVETRDRLSTNDGINFGFKRIWIFWIDLFKEGT